MIQRYSDKSIAGIWSDEQKLAAWLKVELAVINARYLLGIISGDIFFQISNTLITTPVDLEWWKQRDQEIGHDLQAWIEERTRHLPIELSQYFHEGMTSYDTEETAFLILLKQSTEIVFQNVDLLKGELEKSAIRYRYCPMMAVTHGQYAEVQTFGKRCLTWLQEIRIAEAKVKNNLAELDLSKISGAVGNYGGVTSEIESKALEILGFKPFYGATQILPRQFHAPLAESLSALVSVISKIGTDIRLGARSPRPIYQEPFGKKQKGSSRMPQKKNTISSEQLEGMERMSLGYLSMIMQNIRTWEERAIEQSCVERVAWPDLFHVAIRSLKVCTKIIGGLRVYPDHMMQDIIDTRGTWAAGAAKEFLRERLAKLGITTEESYCIVQLASRIASNPASSAEKMRENPPESLEAAEKIFCENRIITPPQSSIDGIIVGSQLSLIPELDITQEQIDKWNKALKQLFHDGDSAFFQYDSLRSVFSIYNRLKDEKHLFEQILGV